MVHRASQQKILLIEDEPVFRMTLGAFLRSKNYLLMESKDGAEGLACVAMFQPDVVLCDLHMPGLTGHQVINIIHQRYPTIPIIVISGVARIDDVTQALREGACDYLLKPITDWAVVTEAIEQSLSNAAPVNHYQELEYHRDLLRKDDYIATKLMQMMQQKSSPITLGHWHIDYISSTPLLYADFYLVNNALMVVIVELYAEMLDVTFVAAMIKFLLDPPYRQYLHHENHIFDSPRNVLSYLNWHICQSGILCNINCAVLLLADDSEIAHFANAGLSFPHWLKKAANLSLGLLPDVEYHNFNKLISYPFEMQVQGEAENHLQLKILRE
jgi:CheY-like chemotaxis protein